MVWKSVTLLDDWSDTSFVELSDDLSCEGQYQVELDRPICFCEGIRSKLDCLEYGYFLIETVLSSAHSSKENVFWQKQYEIL